MKQDTIAFIGCDLTDEVHQLDPTLNEGRAIMWNVTRLQRDALAGVFGPPIKRKLSVMPPQAPAHTANLDWQKVVAFSKDQIVLSLPIITVELAIADRIERHTVDGNHRICARQRAGLDDFETYVVSARIEDRYRVRIVINGVETDLPFDD